MPDLDGIPREEGDRLEEASPTGVLAGKRLDEARQVGEEQVDERPRDELGDPAAAALLEHAVLHDRALVIALHVLDPRLREQRAERPVGHPRVPVPDVRVAPGNEVAARLEEALPEGLALAAVRAVAGQHVGVLDDTRPLGLGDLARAIGRRGVDDEELVHQGHAVDEDAAGPRHDLADRRFFVERR